jgi:hypothetical protein
MGGNMIMKTLEEALMSLKTSSNLNITEILEAIDNCDRPKALLFLATMKVAPIEALTDVVEGMLNGYDVSDYTLPSGIRTIKSRGFVGSNVKYLHAENVETIGESAFVKTDLEEIWLGNVEEIGGYAFDECGQLRRIHYTGTLSQFQNAIALASDWCRNTSKWVLDCADGVICKEQVISCQSVE